MGCAECSGPYQQLRFGGINWYKFYPSARILSQRRLCSEVVGLASFSREAGRRRGRFAHPLELRLSTCTQTVIAGFHRKEKVRPVAVRSYPGAIDSESCRRRSNVDLSIVGPGSPNYVYHSLASVWLCGWVLLLVRFDIEMNFIRPATGSCQSVYRGILSKGRR
jgi:hypothetical protein